MKWTSEVKVFRFQEGASDISLLYSVQSGFGSQRPSIQQALGSLSLEVYRLGRKFDNFYPSSVDFQNVCKNTFIPHMHARHSAYLSSRNLYIP